MNIQELRIGNWYKWYAEGQYYYYQVEAKDFLNKYYKNFEPIELTEEILLKCDDVEFKTNVPKSYYYKNRILIVKENGLIHDYATRVELPYLHTFQNFIFALTNEELKINL